MKNAKHIRITRHQNFSVINEVRPEHKGRGLGDHRRMHEPESPSPRGGKKEKYKRNTETTIKQVYS